MKSKLTQEQKKNKQWQRKLTVANAKLGEKDAIIKKKIKENEKLKNALKNAKAQTRRVSQSYIDLHRMDPAQFAKFHCERYGESGYNDGYNDKGA